MHDDAMHVITQRNVINQHRVFTFHINVNGNGNVRARALALDIAVVGDVYRVVFAVARALHFDTFGEVFGEGIRLGVSRLG